MKKEIGVLMAISSLNNEYSIGSFGKPAEEFIDFLYVNGFTWWQMLPLCIPDELHSPYNSSSIYSINPFFIDIEQLYDEQLITYEELMNEKSINNGICNYKKLNESRYSLLYKAFTRSNESNLISKFIIEYPHINEFCKYQAFTRNDVYKTIARNALCSEIETFYEFWIFTQYVAYKQLKALVHYAKQHNVQLMGDLPLYSSYCSSEFYFYPKNYYVDENKIPTFLSGALPDTFSSTGQCWGHPVYNWDEIRKDNFKFWIDRFSHMSTIFDGIRLDHFRGFESYLAIPTHSRNPLEGHFIPGPGKELFIASQEVLAEKVIVCEDLGVTTPEVQKLIDECGFYNMRVLQDNFGNNFQTNFPTNYSDKCIAYTGTHDTLTLSEYINSLGMSAIKKLKKMFQCESNDLLYETIMESMCKSNAKIIFFPIQDLFRTKDKYVLNTHIPSTENWCYRINFQLTDRYLDIRRI